MSVHSRCLVFASLLLSGTANALEVQTGDNGHVQNPVFSPDGKWLAFEINNLANTVELWIAKHSGGGATGARQLKIPGASSSFGGGGGFAAAPEWLPPSQMLFFEGANPGGNLRIYYAAPSGGAPNEFIPSNTLQGNLTSPTIAEDGSQFAFVSDSTGKGDIYLWNLSGGGAPSTVSPSSSSENFPAFNATGNKMAFSRKKDGTEDVFYWSQAGDGVLKGGAGDQTRPVWAGDDVVYFSSERGTGTWDIAIASSGGGNRRVLARDVKLPSRATPALTPDKSGVVWVSSDPAKADRVMVTGLDGAGTKEISTGLVAVAEPCVVASNGRVFMAFTALPAEGADWRRLQVVDVTGKF